MENPFKTLLEQQAEVIKQLELLTSQLPNNNKDQDEVLEMDGICELLKVTPITIYRKVKSGKIPHMKRGRKLLFSRNDILNWLKDSSNF